MSYAPSLDECRKELEEWKNTQKIIQQHCNHQWSDVKWVWSCGGYRTCLKCGKVEDVYERD